MHLLLIVATFLGLQAPPNLPTEPANPPNNDVWIWIEQPVGAIPNAVTVIKLWAFRCGGSIASVKPFINTGNRQVPFDLTAQPWSSVSSAKPRPDIVTVMQSKCSVTIPTNIGYELTLNLPAMPRDQFNSYAIDVQVTDDLGRKIMLRQTRGTFGIQ